MAGQLVAALLDGSRVVVKRKLLPPPTVSNRYERESPTRYQN